MCRSVSARLRALKGSLRKRQIFPEFRGRSCHRVLVRYASAAVAATKTSSSGGFFGWLTGGSDSTTRLEYPLEGLNLPPPLPDRIEPGKTKITALPNGFKIASENSFNPVASRGLYVDSGSIYETPASFGATHLLERMAFKSTRNRSHLRLVREVEAIGGIVQAAASRELTGYTFDALKTYVPQMVELLVDCVRNQVFLDWEVNEQLHKVKSDISEASKNPQGFLLEAIHSAGYSGALANPLLAPAPAPESSVNRLNGAILEDFVAENYTAPRMVLAAHGVEHEELLSVAEPLLADLPSVPHGEEPKSVYTGSDYRCQGESGSTHFALAFELPGGWRSEKDAVTLTVLQMLKGKVVHSQLVIQGKECTHVYIFGSLMSIPKFRPSQHSPAFTTKVAYLVSDFASEALKIAARELIAIATPGEVDKVQLDHAKHSTKSAILMNLESRMIVAEDMARQILTYGERKPVEHFLKIVEEISLKDITSVSRKLLASPLTMASYGDGKSSPFVDAFYLLAS